jgi:hypothetical protein
MMEQPPPQRRAAGLRRLRCLSAALVTRSDGPLSGCIRPHPPAAVAAAAAAAAAAATADDGSGSAAHAEQFNHFVEHGWAVVPDALSATELTSIRDAIGADRRRFYYQWPLANLYAKYEQGPCYQHVNMLLTSPGALDLTITHPSIFPLVRYAPTGQKLHSAISCNPALMTALMTAQPSGRHVSSSARCCFRLALTASASFFCETSVSASASVCLTGG